MNMAMASKDTTKIGSSSTGRLEGITALSRAEDWVLAPPPEPLPHFPH